MAKTREHLEIGPVPVNLLDAGAGGFNMGTGQRSFQNVGDSVAIFIVYDDRVGSNVLTTAQIKARGFKIRPNQKFRLNVGGNHVMFAYTEGDVTSKLAVVETQVIDVS